MANRPLKPNVQATDLSEINPQNSLASYMLHSVSSVAIPPARHFSQAFLTRRSYIGRFISRCYYPYRTFYTEREILVR